MARIEGEIVIARPVDVVFDYVADQRNEPDYNPRMVRSEKITDGPVGQGTVFSAAVGTLRRAAPMRIECTGYQRPALLASVTDMRQAEFRATFTFDPVPAGTRMRWSEQVRMKGALRLLAPLVTWLGRHQEQAIWTSMKRKLEASLPTGLRTGGRCSVGGSPGALVTSRPGGGAGSGRGLPRPYRDREPSPRLEDP